MFSAITNGLPIKVQSNEYTPIAILFNFAFATLPAISEFAYNPGKLKTGSPSPTVILSSFPADGYFIFGEPGRN